MKTATLIKAKVKFQAAAPLKFEHGERINIVVTLPSGESVKIWGNPDSAIAHLSKGEEVQLLHDGKNYTLLQAADQIAPPPATPSPLAQALAAPAQTTTTPAMDADIKEWLSIYTQFEQARPDLQEGTRRAATSTLFLQRCKIREEFQ